MSGKILGTVKWFSNRKGYGFITPKSDNSPTTEDIFVHQSSIHCEGYRTLIEGWEVEFEAAPDDSGKLKAQNVTAPGGGPCTGPRPRRERKPRDGDDEEEEAAAPPPAAKPNNGDSDGRGPRRNKPNGTSRPPNNNNRENNNIRDNNNRDSYNRDNGGGGERVKKPQWHDILQESVKQSLEAKSVRTSTGTVDVAMGDARVKLGTGGYASLAHASGLLAEGTFTCDEHGQVTLDWQRALEAGADGSWKPTPVETNSLLVKALDLTDDSVIAVGKDETPGSLWGDDKADPKESLEANGFQMRRVVLTRIGGGPGRGRGPPYRRGGPPRRRPPAK